MNVLFQPEKVFQKFENLNWLKIELKQMLPGRTPRFYTKDNIHY